MMSGIRLEVDGEVGIITIDRPKANAIDVPASMAMYEAVRAIETNPVLRVGIVTGAGERFFCAGWDLKAAAQGEPADADFGPGGFAGITEFHDRRKPLIAAVNGLAFGGGFELAMACDLVVASEFAQFALPEAGLGILADSGGILRLPRMIGSVRAAEMLMTGRRIDSATALAWGLVNAVVPAGGLLPAARDLAARVCAQAPLAIAAVLEVWQATDGLAVRDAFGVLRSGALPIHRSLGSSADAKEGIAAFADRRSPRWSGA